MRFRHMVLAAAVSLLLVPGPGHGQSRPPEPYIDRGACPFECCGYGDWTARNPMRVYRAEGDTGEVAFTLVPGQAFTADSGNVHVTRLGIVVIRQPFHQYESHPDGGGLRFEPGDTLFLLSYLGEGHYNVWHEGEVLQAEGYWYGIESATENGAEAEAVLLREPAAEWWVHITTYDGRTGWLRVEDSLPEGADGCG